MAVADADTDFSWAGFRDDLLGWVAEKKSDDKLLAVGHSMGGAVICHALVAGGGVFEKAWVYEPVLPTADSLPVTVLTDRAEHDSNLVVGARRRRATFDSKRAALERYQSRPPYNNLNSEALWAYVEHGFEEMPDGGVKLRCDPEWEARTFEGVLAVSDSQLRQIQVPVGVAISGDISKPVEFAQHAARHIPKAEILEFPQLSHFGPLEDPAFIATSIHRWFQQ